MSHFNSDLQQTIETATRHHEAGRLRHAAALYRRALRQDPGNATVLHKLGVLAHQVGRRADALLLLRRAVVANPSDPVFYEDLGNLHFSRGEFEDAAVCYREAVRLENRAAAHAQLGAALARQGRLEEAVEAYRRAVEASGLMEAARPVRVVPAAPDDAAKSLEPTLFDLSVGALDAMPSDQARAFAAGGPLPEEGQLGIVTPVEIAPDPIEWPEVEVHAIIAEPTAPGGVQVLVGAEPHAAGAAVISAMVEGADQANAPAPPTSQAATPAELLSIVAGVIASKAEAGPVETVSVEVARVKTPSVEMVPVDLAPVVEPVIGVGLLEVEPEPPMILGSDPLVLGRAELEQLGLAPSAGVFQPSTSARMVPSADPVPTPAPQPSSARIESFASQAQEEIEEPQSQCRGASEAVRAVDDGDEAPGAEEESADEVDAEEAAPAEEIEYLKHRKTRRARARARRKPSEAAQLRKQADALLRQRKMDEAIALLGQVVTLMPKSAKSHRDLAAAYLRDDRLEEAVVSLNKALELRPRFVEAYASLGDAYHLQGKLDLAIACYRKVLALRPDSPRANSNLLLTLNYHHKFDPKLVFQEHLRWAERHAAPLVGQIRPHTNEPDPKRRLRIGYVSPDFRRHSVNYFIEPILAQHDHRVFDLYCYSDALRADEVTDRTAAYCDGWRDVRGMRDEDLCKIIRDDRIDILIDLSGHTGTNRLGVFARKPAPVQVTYLGYPNTTGLATIDYRITDGWADPPGMTEQLHTETLVRLPTNFLCYAPPPEAPEPGRPPCLDSKQITFGCFNILAKVTPEVMALWARILAAVPKSRLLMKDRVGSFGYAGRRQYVRDIFRYHRVDPDRLELLGKEPEYARHLQAYGRVDIMLDPFPYNGTTTTCEALWMGVPVVTLGGATHVSRVGVSLLANVELKDCITANGGEYARKAVALASDPDELLFLRDTLRDRMQRSPLTDAEHFARQLEAAYRQMWETWCQNRSPQSAQAPKSDDTGIILSLRDD